VIPTPTLRCPRHEASRARTVTRSLPANAIRPCPWPGSATHGGAVPRCSVRPKKRRLQAIPRQVGQLGGGQEARWTRARQTGQREAAWTQGTPQDQWKRCAQGRCTSTSPARSSSRHTAHSDAGGGLRRPSRLQLNRRRRAAPPTFAGFESTSRCSTHGAAGVAPASGVAGAAVVAECWRLLPPLVLVAFGCGFAVGGRTVPVL